MFEIQLAIDVLLWGKLRLMDVAPYCSALGQGSLPLAVFMTIFICCCGAFLFQPRVGPRDVT